MKRYLEWLPVALAAVLLAFACAYRQGDWEVTKAKRDHRKAHPECVVCGYVPKWPRPANPVHHITPVHVVPDLGATPTNLVTLCDHDHGWLAHCGWHFKEYDANLTNTIAAVRAAVSNHQQRSR